MIVQTNWKAVSALVEEVRQQGMDGVAFDALVARRTKEFHSLVWETSLKSELQIGFSFKLLI